MLSKGLNLVKNNFEELPNNIEAEQSVIGTILVSNEIFDEIIQLFLVKIFMILCTKKFLKQLKALFTKVC